MAKASTGFRLAYGNYAFSAVQTDSISGTGEIDIEKLLLPQLSDRGTVTGTGEVQVNYLADPAAFGLTDNNAEIGLVGLLEVDASFAGGVSRTWRVDIYDDGAVLVYSSGWMQMPTWYDFSKKDLWLHLPSTVYGVDVRIRFNEAGTGTTTITSGACWVSPVWTTARGIDDPWAWIPMPRGESPISKGGQGYPSRGQDLSAIEFSLARMSLIEAYGNPADAAFMDLQRLLEQVSTTEFCVVWPRTRGADSQQSPHLINRLGLYGQFTQLGNIDHVGGDNYVCQGMRLEGRR